MKHVDVKARMSIDFQKENNKEDPKFKVGDNIRISKHKNIFLRDYVPHWSEEFFVIKNLKTLLVILAEKKMLKLFTKNNCKKQIKKSLEMKN